jgi:hypothetical protein
MGKFEVVHSKLAYPTIAYFATKLIGEDGLGRNEHNTGHIRNLFFLMPQGITKSMESKRQKKKRLN